MSMTGNGGSAELRDERKPAPGRVNMDRLEAELGGVPSPPIRSTGGRFTDTVEREIEERLYPHSRDRLF